MARTKRWSRRRWFAEVVSFLAVYPLIYAYVSIVKAIDPAWLERDLARIVVTALGVMVTRSLRDWLLERGPLRQAV